MAKYDVVRIELNDNPNETSVFTRMKGDIKGVKVWVNGKKVFDHKMSKEDN